MTYSLVLNNKHWSLTINGHLVVNNSNTIMPKPYITNLFDNNGYGEVMIGMPGVYCSSPESYKESFNVFVAIAKYLI